MMNDNLNILASLLKKRGITLIFMPVVDKYNLYADCISNNDLPISTFFEKFRQQKKSYRFIDTKEILHASVKKGMKDVYHPDDTHWSQMGSAEIVKKLF